MRNSFAEQPNEESSPDVKKVDKFVNNRYKQLPTLSKKTDSRTSSAKKVSTPPKGFPPKHLVETVMPKPNLDLEKSKVIVTKSTPKKLFTIASDKS